MKFSPDFYYILGGLTCTTKSSRSSSHLLHTHTHIFSRNKTNRIAMDQNWRAGLGWDSRTKIVHRIMDTLQRNTALSAHDLRKCAKRFEKKVFYAASNQHDYLRRISLKMLDLETMAKHALPTSSSGMNFLDFVGSDDSLQQEGQTGGIDEADIAWSKMQTLKDKYFQDMKVLCNMLTNSCQQHMPEEQLQKLTHYKNVLQRMVPYLTASKGSLPKEFKQEKVELFEKQIVRIMETFKRRKQVAPHPQQQQQQHNLGQVQAVQQPQQAYQILQSDNKLVQQETPKMNSPLTGPTELQSSSTSFLNVSLLQQATSASANTLHQGNIAAFGQNAK